MYAYNAVEETGWCLARATTQTRNTRWVSLRLQTGQTRRIRRTAAAAWCSSANISRTRHRRTWRCSVRRSGAVEKCPNPISRTRERQLSTCGV